MHGHTRRCRQTWRHACSQMHARMHAHAPAHTRAQANIHMYTCTHVRVSVCTHTSTCTYTCARARAHAHAHAHMHTCTHMYVGNYLHYDYTFHVHILQSKISDCELGGILPRGKKCLKYVNITVICSFIHQSIYSNLIIVISLFKTILFR